MTYKIKPFIAKVSNKGSAEDVAYQVESFIERKQLMAGILLAVVI